MNIYTTPEALQGVCARNGDIINATFSTANQTIAKISCTGNIQVHTIYNGVATTETYSDLTNTVLALKADADTLVSIEGEVTKLIFHENLFITLGTIDLKNIITNNSRNLQYLDVSTNLKLTSLDVSKNTALTTLYCTSCTSLTSLRCNAYNEGVTSKLSAAITDATSTTGTVTVFAPLTYASTIKTAATTKGWTYTEQETA